MLIVPKRCRIVSQPSTQPGTDHESGPDVGMSFKLREAKKSRVARYGDRPLAFRP
jgi:hypothetical protein